MCVTGWAPKLGLSILIMTMRIGEKFYRKERKGWLIKSAALCCQLPRKIFSTRGPETAKPSVDKRFVGSSICLFFHKGVRYQPVYKAGITDYLITDYLPGLFQIDGSKPCQRGHPCFV